MSHAIYHAQSSARRFGGKPEDYLAIHEWFDASKAFIADARHRALRHHAQGIFWCEEVFGRTITNSAGRAIPVRLIGEQHVMEDFQKIPTLSQWLEEMTLQEWMFRSVAVLPKLFKEKAALPELMRQDDAAGLQEEVLTLTTQLAVLNGQLFSSLCLETLNKCGPHAWSLETVLSNNQLQVQIFDKAGTLLDASECNTGSFPYPCTFYRGQLGQLEDRNEKTL